MTPRRMIYVGAVPEPGVLPAGWVLVHNHVRPQPALGMNGFRAWIEPWDESRLVACDCGWGATSMLAHYRVIRRRPTG